MNRKQNASTSSNGIQYLLYLPPGFDKRKKFPLLLFLHGAGERGSNLNAVKKHGPPKIIESGKELPFIVVSPQCPQGKYWQPHALSVLLDEVLRETNADEERIYVTGISMGGYGTWALSISYPERFAAIIPICGGGEDRLVHRIRHLPVWVFHGAKDYIVPVDESEAMVDALEKLGGNVKFTVYPEADHDSWTATYNNPEIYEWLLSHKRLHGPHTSS